ncbi:MAG: 3'-5' exonuclease [Bacteroidales bacterium]|nr:3'-5' exonuclease [Bacteroidales bacterium]
MKTKLDEILFIDIETVPANPDFAGLNEDFQKFWDKKSAFFRGENETAEDVYQRAGIYAEFGKIVCISVGLLFQKDGIKKFRLKSFAGHDEKQLLNEFADMLNGYSPTGDKVFCGHNIKEFDMPYISRRMIINGIKLPEIINLHGKKPWEVNHIDTLELWKFGDYKNYTSLDLLANLFNIPTPKDDIDGSQVAQVYYEENNLERIVKYCEKDVLTVARLYLKMKLLPGIDDENVEYA